MQAPMPNASLFLYKIQAVRHDMLTQGATPEEERTISEHFNYLERLTQDGIVRLAGRTLTKDYAGFGIIILSADSEEAARAIVLNDPAVRNRVMRAELYPFRIALLGTLRTSDDPA
jgi:uncharacterized protein YciI